VFSENAERLGVEPSRIAVVGGSAGGGLTAAVSLLARDRKGPSIAFQMPLYPMIDDRNITPSSNEIIDDRVWNGKFNRQGWEMHLGNNKGEVSPYAAPARSTDL
jgi:acetyl esterase/lipase